MIQEGVKGQEEEEDCNLTPASQDGAVLGLGHQ